MSGGWLEGLSVLVTGGGSGIGRGVVDAYVAEGARVTVLERSAERCADLRDRHGGRVTAVQGDTADPADVRRAVDAAAGADGRLDNLTVCAGVFDGHASLRDIPPAVLPAAFEEVYRVNVLGCLVAVSAALPRLVASRGSVTLTLSVSAFHPEGGGVLYGSSKWALRGVVAHLARDLAPEVRVNGVAPGGTGGTRLAGLASLGQQVTADRVPGRDERIREGNVLRVLPLPEDHAGAYVYLASPERARVVTGAVVNTDGGRG
jgi:NAD(P)-dependent dehydrogenase (short-subunit alcohol dehydrogenase family)